MSDRAATSVSAPQLTELYRDLHRHPELSFQEARTARVVATHLGSWGYEVTSEVGGTGVVGVLRNGDGPTALLRADMDGLPVLEDTGLTYASRERATDRFGADVPVMHACGHDVHVACLLGAASRLAAHPTSWSGTVMAVFQPAEELGSGARAMVDDGLFDRWSRPDVVLGQHVSPLPAGALGMHPGLTMASSDSLTVTLHGQGGHGSRPETTVDPVVMAAATVMRLQTIVSRETAATETAVLTIGSLHAGTTSNVIPDRAVLGLNLRTVDPGVRQRILTAITRVVEGEAAASGTPTPPVVDHTDHFPALVTDLAGMARTRAAFEGWLGQERVVDPGVVTGSEDVGVLALAAGAPCVFWLLGGADPALYAGAATPAELMEVVRRLPSNHSPHFAPVVSPTLEVGVEALVVATREWLPA